MSNKSVGNQVEDEFAQMMFSKGWWAHVLAYNAQGQPFDAILHKDGRTMFVDVKNVQDGDFFLTKRIEENQKNAFRMLIARGCDPLNVGVAVRFDDGFFYFATFGQCQDARVYKRNMQKL